MSAPPFTVEGGARRVVARSAIVVPCEARGDARELRSALRGALAGLVVGPDEVCAGTFHGARRPGTDVENLLLYNLDTSGRLFDGGGGIRVEHAPSIATVPDAPFTYVYEPASVDAGFGSWEVTGLLARWADVPISPGASERLLARTWSALAGGPRHVMVGRVDGAVGIRVRVGLPGGARRGNLAAKVKGLLDGIICALSTDAGSPPDAVARVARQLGRDTGSVIADLSRHPTPFGPHRLVVPRGHGVQWLPPDDRLVAAEVVRAPPSDVLSISGELVALRPRLP